MKNIEALINHIKGYEFVNQFIIFDKRLTSHKKYKLVLLSIIQGLERIKYFNHPHLKFDLRIKPLNCRGMYVESKNPQQVDRIYLNPYKTIRTLNNPSIRACGIFGRKADITPGGVLCHEYGHKFYFNYKLQNYWKQVVKFAPTKGITSYANTNVSEDFAETFRLFLTNPKLLSVVDNFRYKCLLELFYPEQIEIYLQVPYTIGQLPIVEELTLN